MITYMNEFMDWYQYPSEAREALIECYQKLEDSRHSISFWHLVEAYEQGEEADFEETFQTLQQIAKEGEIHCYTLNLLYLIAISKHLRTLYENMNWTEVMYDDAMLDLKYKLLECYRLHNVWGNFVIWWEIGFFQLKRIALGRLQFELWEFPTDYEKDGNKLCKGDKVVNMHIPSSGTLKISECEKSFELAARFYKKEFGEGPVPFMCTSWLLYPANRLILPKDSNIVRFMSLFDIFETIDDEEKQDLWRIYMTEWEKEPSQLPRTTSLQRAYADWLQQGNPVGMGQGVFFR